MTEIDSMRARVETAAGLADLLQAGWDAFSLLLAACRDGEDRSAELFGAFAFASAAAARGRRGLALASSLPAGPGAGNSYGPCAEPDLEKIADGLADLAGALDGRLSAAALQARAPGDRQACQDAAAEAARICELLARGG